MQTLKCFNLNYQAGTNTVIYCPLDSTNTNNDLSGHEYTLNYNNVSYGVNQGVDCAWFSTGSGHKGLGRNVRDVQVFGNNYTRLVWLYKDDVSMSGSPRIISAYYTDAQIFAFNSLKIISVKDELNHGVVPDNKKWFLFGATYDGFEVKFYKNGRFVDEVQYTRSTTQNSGLVMGTDSAFGTSANDKRGGGMSRLIIENRLLGEEQIMGHFMSTRKIYGI